MDDQIFVKNNLVKVLYNGDFYTGKFIEQFILAGVMRWRCKLSSGQCVAVSNMPELLESNAIKEPRYLKTLEPKDPAGVKETLDTILKGEYYLYARAANEDMVEGMSKQYQEITGENFVFTISPNKEGREGFVRFKTLPCMHPELQSMIDPARSNSAWTVINRLVFFWLMVRSGGRINHAVGV